jgi:transketolase
MQLTMRDAFFDRLFEIASSDHNVVVLTADFGSPSLDKFRDKLPAQYINIGISEQNMISIAAGLALSGKKVYVYAILPFLIMRAYEQIKTDICSMNLDVTMVGVGTGYSYNNAGDTHYAPQDIALMRVLPNLTIWSPADSNSARNLALITYRHCEPQYIRLDRVKSYIDEYVSLNENGIWWREFGDDILIITTGIMIDTSLKVCEKLNKRKISPSVYYVWRLKPLALEISKRYHHVVTIEEHYLEGGLGSIIAELIADSGQDIKLKRFGLPLQFNENLGSRESLHKLVGLDVESITQNIIRWLK